MILYFLLFVISFHAIADDDFFSDDTVDTTQQEKNYYDPLEKINRGTFWVSSLLTKGVILPIANVYKHTIPQKIQPNILSFTGNVTTLFTLPYASLIPHKPLFIENSSIFMTNSIFGFFGFFDIHSRYIQSSQIDTSLDNITQYYSPVKLPYLFLPWGPGNIIAGPIDFQGQIYFRSIFPREIWFASFIGIITQFSTNYDIIYDGLYNSVNPYAVTRNVYYSLQKRNIERIKQSRYEHTKYQTLLPDGFL